MSEMIERVALAISGGDSPASILQIHRTRARAAIEAMRKPTGAMQAAFLEVYHPGGRFTPFDQADYVAAHHNMISAALRGADGQ